MPVRKYVIIAPDSFHRILPMAKAAMEPTSRQSISVTPQTIAEFKVATPSLPAVHAKL